MLVSDILGSIVISIQLIAAFAAKEEALRTAIRTMLIATSTTHLRGVPGVNTFDMDTPFLRFVDGEGIELRKGPGVQFSLVVTFLTACLAASHLGGLSNVGEVLKDNGTARRSVLHNALAQNVVTIPVEASLLTRQLFEVSFEAETAAVNLFPVLPSQEVMLGGDGWPIQAKVNSDDLRSLGDNRLRHIHHHMQPELPLAVDEVSSSNLVTRILATPMRHGEGNSQLASTTREPDRLPIPVKRVGVDIVANRTEVTLWHLDRLELRDGFATLPGFGDLLLIGRFVLLLPGKCTLEGFRGFYASLNEMVRHQSRTRGFRLIVHRMMQFHPVLLAVLPTIV